MKKKVYIETTIPSYLVAKPSRDIVLLTHQEFTKQWWESCKDDYELFTSQETIDEANSGDPVYAKQRYEILETLQLLDPATEVEQLANEYFKYFNFPVKALRDAAHLAFAVYYELDYLLTWNCKYLANASIRSRLHRLNDSLGYKTPDVCTPEELIPVEEG